MEITNVAEVIHALTKDGKPSWGSRAVVFVLEFVKVTEEKINDLVLSGLMFSANLYKAREKTEIALTDYNFNDELKQIASDFIGFESDEKQRLLENVNTRLKGVINEEITHLKLQRADKT